MRNGTLYTGVSSDLIQRVWHHKNGTFKKCFTYRYYCKMLFYYEIYDTMEQAIMRENRLRTVVDKISSG